jgi:hypothetical protein
MYERPKLYIPPGSQADLFGRFGYDAPDPQAMGIQEAPGEAGNLPPLFPSLTPAEQYQALQTFGLRNPMQAYPADIDPALLSAALLNGQQQQAANGINQPGQPGANTKGNFLNGMLGKAAGFALGAAPALLGSAQSRPAAYPLPNPQNSHVDVRGGEFVRPMAPEIGGLQSMMPSPFGNRWKQYFQHEG